MKIEWIIFCAIVLDLLVGDPRSLPHPVRFIGKFARRLEPFYRSLCRSPFFAGLLTAVTVYAVTFFIPFSIIHTCKYAGVSWLGDIFSIFVIYTTIAIRDLLDHSRAVYVALKSSDLDTARKKVGMIVGRDTQNLSQAEIVRACVESVAESLVDGITAPLFFAVFGGPAWAMLYRAINTLDSLFGHKDERYEHFGTVAARVDDVANFIPARLTSPVIPIASMLLNLRPWRSFCLYPLGAFRILFRDGRKHASPNAGLPEAAVAGALGVRIGGTNFYDGVPSEKPFIGDEREQLMTAHISIANTLMVLTSLLSAFFFISIRRWIVF